VTQPPAGPPDGRTVPRFAGPDTFARLPRLVDVGAADVALPGIPFDSGASGTAEPGGLTSRELQFILRGLDGLRLVGADVVEVSPPYDHAELTALAAANVAYEMLSLFARGAR